MDLSLNDFLGNFKNHLDIDEDKEWPWKDF